MSPRKRKHRRASDVMPELLKLMRLRPTEVHYGHGGWMAELTFEVFIHDKEGVLEAVEHVVNSTRLALEASGDGFRMFAHTRGFKEPPDVPKEMLPDPMIVVEMNLKPIQA